MSMPVLTYGCTQCDLMVWNSITWGYRFYRVEKKQYRMAVGMGWCYSCGDLAPVEKRPQASMEQQLHTELLLLAERVNLLRKQQPRSRWGVFRKPSSGEQLRAELKVESLNKELLRLRSLMPLMKDRQNGDRCLICSSEACFHLPGHALQASFDEIHEQPQLLNCLHPGCGGQFTVSSDGTRLMVAGRARAYDLRGVPLGDWEPL